MSGSDLSAWLVNAVIAITLLEGVLLILSRALGGRGPAPADIVPNLGAGLCLLGALRSALAGAGWMACASWLAAAGVAHALDLRRRWPPSNGTTRLRRRPIVAAATSPLDTKRPS